MGDIPEPASRLLVFGTGNTAAADLLLETTEEALTPTRSLQKFILSEMKGAFCKTCLYSLTGSGSSDKYLGALQLPVRSCGAVVNSSTKIELLPTGSTGK